MQQETMPPGDGPEIAPQEARQANRVGLWKMLVGSLALAIIGILIVGGIFGAAT